jgi:hypothetical protein
VIAVPVVYFAHRVGAADRAGVADNLAAARRWFALLLELWPDVALVASWLPYLDALDDCNPSHRERGTRDQRAIVRRCDGIVLCGPTVSRGMVEELEIVLAARGFAVSLAGVEIEERGEVARRLAIFAETSRRSIAGKVLKFETGGAPVCCYCHRPIEVFAGLELEAGRYAHRACTPQADRGH